MRIPGMPPAMKPEELYRRLGRIIEMAPAPPNESGPVVSGQGLSPS